MKTKNNDSEYCKDWTTAKLKEEVKNYHETIYETECFGTRDLRMYSAILAELKGRGIEIKEKIYFVNE